MIQTKNELNQYLLEEIGPPIGLLSNIKDFIVKNDDNFKLYFNDSGILFKKIY